MGIRETLNKNPGITTGVTAGIIVLALIFIIWQVSSSGTPSVSNEAWYTIDDGKTWFADSADKIPPFQKDGKTAYRVYVYKCKDGKEFVTHLERYTEPAKKALENARAKGGEGDPALLETIFMQGVEVKDPGNGDDPKNWVKQSDYARAQKITEPKCPGGGQEGLEAVVPD